MKLDPHIIPCKKKKKDLEIDQRPKQIIVSKTIKLPEERIRILCHLWLLKDFLHTTKPDH